MKINVSVEERMTNILVYLSDYAIPIVIFYILIMGLFSKCNLFDDFLVGAKEGLKIVVDIGPTLIGLMTAIGVMRASGVFDLIVRMIEPVTRLIRFPTELLPLVIIKLFSSSAATSLLIDIYKQFGADSYQGILSSIMMSSSETVFYVLAVYSAAGKIKKTRYIVLGGLVATVVGILCSICLVR